MRYQFEFLPEIYSLVLDFRITSIFVSNSQVTGVITSITFRCNGRATTTDLQGREFILSCLVLIKSWSEMRWLVIGGLWGREAIENGIDELFDDKEEFRN